MKGRKSRPNPKRRIDTAFPVESCEALALRVTYGGNPEHKRNPGDFNLMPPAHPRPDKSLCDVIDLFRRAEALALLQGGARAGLVSEQRVNGWPQNIWAVTSTGVPVEAQLENSESGAYHGYPLPDGDPFGAVVLEAWKTATLRAVALRNRATP